MPHDSSIPCLAYNFMYICVWWAFDTFGTWIYEETKFWSVKKRVTTAITTHKHRNTLYWWSVEMPLKNIRIGKHKSQMLHQARRHDSCMCLDWSILQCAQVSSYIPCFQPLFVHGYTLGLPPWCAQVAWCYWVEIYQYDHFTTHYTVV